MGSNGGKKAAQSLSAAERQERAKLAGIASGKTRIKKAAAAAAKVRSKKVRTTGAEKKGSKPAGLLIGEVDEAADQRRSLTDDAGGKLPLDF